MSANPARADRFGFVTDQVRADLERFILLLREWQAVHNLVSRASLEYVWNRHVLDSLQLLDHAPHGFHNWVDLGSGAGFPGLILAIASKAHAGRRFVLIESNHKKAAFLRAAVRQAEVQAEVVADRIETYSVARPGSADVVSARALADLSTLCGWAAPLLVEGRGVVLLLKGQDFASEADAASKSWAFDMLSTQSVTDSDGRVVSLRNLRRRAQP